MNVAIVLIPLMLLILSSAICMVFLKNLLHSALMLIISLLLIAVLYVFLFADFLAVSQILIYAGGILVIILFGIMLTQQIGVVSYAVINSNKWYGIISCSTLFLVMGYYILQLELGAPVATNPIGSTIQPIGKSLLTTYLLPFELVTILLTVALIGAALIANKVKR